MDSNMWEIHRIKTKSSLLSPLQTCVCSPVKDTLRGLGAAAYFCQLTFSQTRCPLALRALQEQTGILIMQKKFSGANILFYFL